MGTFEIVTKGEAKCQNCNRIVKDGEPRLRYYSGPKGSFTISKSLCILPCLGNILDDRFPTSVSDLSYSSLLETDVKRM